MRRLATTFLAVVLALAVAGQPLLAGDGHRASDGDGRERLCRQLVDQGRSLESAWASVSRLTPEDLRVLLENPRMMQAAGADAGLTMLVGILLIAGLIAIAAAGDGFVMIG